ncbi:MAG: (d)CMP kinase [Roseburia sp.]
MMRINIAIDGPAGAGKSTIAKLFARKHGLVYVDTGAMYRAMAYYFLSHKIAPEDEQAIAAACEGVAITISYEDGEQQVFLNGENVTGIIRGEAVGKMASATSVYPAVRKKLLELQRQLAKKEDVVMDGRDIGTCVLPDARIKIYLTASPKTRAKRRFDELTAKGVACNLTEIEHDMIDRDNRDMNRKEAPLRKAEDAVLIDSSVLTMEEVIAAIEEICKGCREYMHREEERGKTVL